MRFTKLKNERRRSSVYVNTSRLKKGAKTPFIPNLKPPISEISESSVSGMKSIKEETVREDTPKVEDDTDITYSKFKKAKFKRSTKLYPFKNNMPSLK